RVDLPLAAVFLVADAVAGAAPDPAQDRRTAAPVRIQLHLRPRLTAAVVDGLDADHVVVGVVGRPARPRPATRVPAHPGRDHPVGAVALQYQLGQRTGKVRPAVLHDPPVVGAATGSVVAEHAADVEEVTVPALAP